VLATMNNRQLKKQAAKKHNAEYIENKRSPLLKSIRAALSAARQARRNIVYKSKG